MRFRSLTKGAISSLLMLIAVVPSSIANAPQPTRENEVALPHQFESAPVSQSAPKVKNRLRVPQYGRATSPLLSVVDQTDIRRPHRIIADQVLRALQSPCTENLKHFYVRYDQMERRGLASSHTIILDGNVPDNEFRTLLVHEFAHTMDLGCMKGTAASGPSDFRDGDEVIFLDDPSVLFYDISWQNEETQLSGTRGADFASGYAASDPFEDLAESVTYFVFQNNAFRLRAEHSPALAAKFAWIEQYLFPKPVNIATGNHRWNGIVPWDSTKLPYTWHPWEILASAKTQKGT